MEAFDLAILGMICLFSSMIRDGDDPVAIAAAIIFFLSSLTIYFYPTIRAAADHQRIGAILALNLLTGWTLVGWVRIPRHLDTQPTIIWTLVPCSLGHLIHVHLDRQSERSDAVLHC